jgi:hypothetical protein
MMVTPNLVPAHVAAPAEFADRARRRRLTRLRGLRHFSRCRPNKIKVLTKKVFTTNWFLEAKGSLMRCGGNTPSGVDFEHPKRMPKLTLNEV